MAAAPRRALTRRAETPGSEFEYLGASSDNSSKRNFTIHTSPPTAAPMRRYYWTFYVPAIAIVLATAGGCTNTYRWDEEVATHDGRVIKVARRAKFNAPPFSRLEGGGGNLSDEIEFVHAGRTVHWKHSTDSIPINRASILDIVNGEPVIVVPINTHVDCAASGYPLEGYVAYSWRGGRWERLESRTLPSGLKENLLATHAMKESQAAPYLGQLVTLQDRPALERDQQRGRTLQAITDAPDPFDQSCRRFRPPANAAAAALTRAIVEELASAPSLAAVAVTKESDSLFFTREEVAKAMGDRVWNGVPARNCADVVASVRFTANTSPDWRRTGESVGQEIVLADLSSAVDAIRIPKEHWTSGAWSIESVFCTKSTVYVMTRRTRESIALLQFLKKGEEFGGMVLVDLPRPEPLSDKVWLSIFAPQVQEGKLMFLLAREIVYQEATVTLRDSYRVSVALPESWKAR